MSNYIVSARKYRPATFDSVVGQHALTTTLKNAIATGKLAHAYLFCGPRGVGKTTCARIFARTINCLHPKENGEACNECESCRAFNEGRSYNIHELDAASNNSVEDIRSLIEQVAIPPQVGRYKVFIIDEVHMLSQAAFNAFLKTLEEPPAHAIFILATTEKHKILPTILSRCQIYDFNRMEIADIVGHLKHVAEAEGIEYEEEALGVIARKADGGMRDAMSIFDQVAGYSEGHITYQKVIEDLGVLDTDYYFRLTDDLLKPDIPAALLLLDEVIGRGFEPNHFVAGLASHLRDLLVSRDKQTVKLLEVADVVRERYVEQAAHCQPKFLYRALKLCNTCDINYRTSSNKRLLVELTLIEIAQANDDGEACGLGPTVKTLKPIFASTASREASRGGGLQAADKAAQATQAAPSTPSAQSSPTPPSTQSIQSTLSNQSKQSIQSTLSTPSTPSPQANNPSNLAQRRPVDRRPVTSTLSIRPTMGQGQKAASAVGTGASQGAGGKAADTARSESFDQKDLSYHWYRFASTLPVEQAAMAGRLQNIEPTVVSAALIGGQETAAPTSTPAAADGTITVDVPVENELVIKYMEQLRPSLTAYLRDNLRNDHIQLSFRLVAPTEQRRVYSRREQYAAMLQKSEPLTLLSERFKLELT